MRFCPICGKPMSYHIFNGMVYWVCSNKRCGHEFRSPERAEIIFGTI